MYIFYSHVITYTFISQFYGKEQQFFYGNKIVYNNINNFSDKNLQIHMY